MRFHSHANLTHFHDCLYARPRRLYWINKTKDFQKVYNRDHSELFYCKSVLLCYWGKRNLTVAVFLSTQAVNIHLNLITVYGVSNFSCMKVLLAGNVKWSLRLVDVKTRGLKNVSRKTYGNAVNCHRSESRVGGELKWEDNRTLSQWAEWYQRSGGLGRGNLFLNLRHTSFQTKGRLVCMVNQNGSKFEFFQNL